MHCFRFATFLCASLLLACSSSTSNNTPDGGASTVTGSLEGHPFTAKSALAWVDVTGGQVGFIFDKVVTCAELPGLTPNGTPLLRNYDGTYIWLDMSGVGELNGASFLAYGADGATTDGCALGASGTVTVTSLATPDDGGTDGGPEAHGTIVFDKATCAQGNGQASGSADGTITYTLCQ